MNLNAKQINHLDVTRMDITTVLGFFLQVKDVISANTALATALDTVWTTYTAALDDYDGVYAQSRKWLQTDELKALELVPYAEAANVTKTATPPCAPY